MARGCAVGRNAYQLCGGLTTAGTAGAIKLAHGSAMGEEGDCQVPVVPPRKFVGVVVGAPKTPKFEPVKLLPPYWRLIVPPEEQPPCCVAAAQVLLFEFTWTLFDGPPMTSKVAEVSWISNAWVQIGSSTMMGIGADEFCSPHFARACTVWVDVPLRSEEKYTFTPSYTSTWIKGLAPVMVVSAVAPGTEPGKLTCTPFVSVLAGRGVALGLE